MDLRAVLGGLLGLCVLCGLPTPGRCDAMPDAPASKITVQREEEPKVAGQSGWVSAQSYASLESDDLLRGIRTGDTCVLLRSVDGGKTWGEPQVMAKDTAVGENLIRTPSVAALYLDPSNGLLVCFVSEVIRSTGSGIAYADASGHGPHTGRLFYQISRDGGHTWSPAQQLVETGPEYDSEHWAKDVWFGRSALVIEGQSPYRFGDGNIIIPAYLWPTAEYMDGIFKAQERPESLSGDARYFVEARCLTARWKADLSGLEFTSGGPIRVRGGYTRAGSCGSDEPAIAYLTDQRWLAVVRTSTGDVVELKRRGIPLVRMSALTTDGGASWGPDEPLLFDDGSEMYSPAAWSVFIRASRTGKWYWIGNILPEPTYGPCDPRYPLQIVELDPETLRLKRATVTVIEDKAPDDDKLVRFSNFRVYEERETGDFILVMEKSYSEFAPAGLPTPLYRYRIQLPER